MAYTESHYLDVNAEQELRAGKVLDEQCHHTDDVANYALYEQHHAAPVNVESNDEGAVSDYCGFVSEEVPPIYREQLQQALKSKMSAVPATSLTANLNLARGVHSAMLNNDKYFSKPAKEAKDDKKSMYIWNQGASSSQMEPEVLTNIYTKDYATMDVMTIHDYVPGFSPPQHNDEIHKLTNHALPRGGRSVCATENLFYRNGTSWVKSVGDTAAAVKSSAYVPANGEHFDEINTVVTKKRGGGGGRTAMTMTAAASLMASQTGTVDSSEVSQTETSSVLTAQLGPKLGAVFKTPNSGKNEKYKGLSAFKPVSLSVESEYAFEGLN